MWVLAAYHWNRCYVESSGPSPYYEVLCTRGRLVSITQQVLSSLQSPKWKHRAHVALVWNLYSLGKQCSPSTICELARWSRACRAQATVTSAAGFPADPGFTVRHGQQKARHVRGKWGYVEQAAAAAASRKLTELSAIAFRGQGFMHGGLDELCCQRVSRCSGHPSSSAGEMGR